VLSVYWPTAYDHESPLKDGSFASYKQGTIAGLAKLLPGAERKIVDVRLARWGHALCHGRRVVHGEVGDRQARRRPRALRPLGQPGAAGVRIRAGRGIEAGKRAKEQLARG